MTRPIAVTQAIIFAVLLLAFTVMQSRADISAGRHAEVVDPSTSPVLNVVAEPTHFSNGFDNIDSTDW
jgi:hypothetical protein